MIMIVAVSLDLWDDIANERSTSALLLRVKMEGFARQSTQTISVLAKKDTMENIASLVATTVTLIRVKMVVFVVYQTLKDMSVTVLQVPKE